ncbi:hypothetical protein [Flammeovirga sp. SubArs3]|uniref:HNH endonuclease n=1 Tax=Flammeovirga sp. SubArs3 TaxID=2995316 RepID=UPI00248CCBB0|nr:hypothetical protein [Flammeovirga sp. SubArs3]
MINLKCSERNEIDDINNIIIEKNNGVKKETLKKLQSLIVSRYNKYIEIKELKRCANISFSSDDIIALQSLYSSKTVTAKEITQQVLDNLNPNHSETCLYCGVGEIDQIDHFLPQKFFPEFSILHKNLIPICGKCNQIKGDKIAGINGVNYIHSIFDKLPMESYLKCNISYTGIIPVVEYSIKDSFSTSVIAEHFRNLKINQRIIKKSVQYFLQSKALKEQFGGNYALDELQRDLVKTKLFFNDFFWKTELINEMLNSDFINKV